jgi:hypothetical protein
MRLVVAVYLRVQAGKAHQERSPGAGVAEDKEFLAWEELPDLRNFLSRDGRNGVALFSSRIAFEQDAGSGFET